MKPSKPKLQERLQAAFPAPTDDHFAYHATDLYVSPVQGVREWLSANYEFFDNIRTFQSAGNSEWAGAGKTCLDIPFAWKLKE